MVFKNWISKRKTPFVLIGQERSGSTFVQTLLSSHSQIHCRGELFDPWQIDDSGRKIKEKAEIFARDVEPAAFIRAKLAGTGLSRPVPEVIGFKLLTHHNSKVLLDAIPQHKDWKIIHVRRANKLAQFSSRQQVNKSGRWTSSSDVGEAPLVDVAPGWAIAQCHALELEDALLHSYLGQLENPLFTLNYTALLDPETQKSLVAFLGADTDLPLSSPLKKQGQNKILSRFKNADDIRDHFVGSGFGHWLEDELALT